MTKFKSVEELLNFQPQKNDNEIEILIGMGTCGIAAGADKVLEYLTNEIEQRNLKNVTVKKTGCLGLCFSEPNVEIKSNNLPDVLYAYVDVDFAKKIITKHIIEGEILEDNLIDKPYIDVYEE